MFFPKLILLNLFIAIIVFNNTSCNKKTSSKTLSKELRLNFVHFPSSIDPRLSTDALSSTLSFMIYEGLTHLEPDGKVSLALAESFKISKDQKSYLFKLRPSYWSNGKPLTAYDFEDSWKQVLSPSFNSSAAELLYPIKNGEKIKKGECLVEELGVKALDAHTLLVELEYPTPYFLQLTAYPTYFPIPKGRGKVFLPSTHSEMITNGPFKLVLWKDKSEIKLQKNPYFWAEKEVKIEKIHIIHISDELAPLYLFEKNRLDWIGGYLSPLPLSSLSHLDKLNILKTHQTLGTTLCLFNVIKPPLHNLNIRKALSFAIDTALFDDGMTQLASDSLISSPFKEKKYSTDSVENRGELARKHFALGMQELGILKKDFPTLTYSYFSTEVQRNVAMIMQNQWNKVLDLHVELEASEYKTLFSKLKKGNFTLAQTAWIGQYSDIMALLTRLESRECTKNFGKWEHPLYKDLIKQSYHTTPELRQKCIEKAKQILTEEFPIMPLYHFCLTYIQNPNLKNVTISPLGHPHFRKAYFDL